LCRTLRVVHWRELKVNLGPGVEELLGVPPDVFASNRDATEEWIANTMRHAMYRGDDAAVLMAWLQEAQQQGSESAGPDPGRAHERWWLGLRKKLGLVEHRYLELLPESYARETERKYPLILFLHGAGERGIDVDLVRRHGPHKYLMKHPELEFILIEPQCPPGDWWNAADVLDVLESVRANYRVDDVRIYLTGLSMGGFGTWAAIAEAPERFAAAVPICGGGKPRDAEKLARTPLWVFHGAKDEVVPPERSREMVDAVRNAGGDVKYTEYPEAKHDSWTETYNNPELYRWLLEHQR
jgi:pimeloyl-ACP methyl ester carboxylesterase